MFDGDFDAGQTAPKTGRDPQRSGDSRDNGRSRLLERTLTAPPVDSDRLPAAGNPARPNSIT
jgi:hypothetical protein